MAATRHVLRVHHDGPAVTLQVEGRATMHHGLPLRRLAEQALDGETAAVRVDLRRCTYMDSTFIGTLLCLQRLAGRREPGAFALVSPSPECQRLLREMGLERLCAVEAAEELPAGAWTEVACVLDDVDDFKRNVVQAHRELAALPGPAGEAFRDAVQGLDAEGEAGRPQPNEPPPPGRGRP